VCFTRQDNDKLRGVRRDVALQCLLPAAYTLSDHKRKRLLALKAEHYRATIHQAPPSTFCIDGVTHLLEGLRAQGVTIAVASASRHASELIVLAGLQPLVDIVSGGDHSGAPKPAPDQLLLLSRKIGAKPSDCLVVEDSAAGIEAARRAGMYALAIGNGLDHQQHDVPWLPSLRGIDAQTFWKTALGE
jgi:HAD superfamily hydrolase (TIGR01509 family)